MAYVKNIWVDQDVERPKTYEVTNNQDGSITLTDSFGLVTELGTPVNEVNMNHIEDGIAGCAIRKHNLTETFALGEWVLGGTGDNEGIYKSLIADNVGNAITDDTAWEKVEMGGGSSRNIGEIVASTIPLTDAGLHLLDGALIQGSGSYSAFVDYIADLYNSGDYSARFTTEANWQASVASNGLCSQFVYDSVNNTVRLPKWGNIAYTKQYTLTLASTVPVVGNGKTLGLTNGTDNFGVCNASNYVLQGYKTLYNKSVGDGTITAGTTAALKGIGVVANSDSGLVANTSGVAGLTNDPLSCYYYIVVAASTKTDIEVDIDEIATDLNGKADVDLTNVSSANMTTAMIRSNTPVITETYINGSSGYVIYSNKLCEQWGVSNGSGTRTITLTKAYADMNYNLVGSSDSLINTYDSSSMIVTASTFTIYTQTANNYYWRTIGIIS